MIKTYNTFLPLLFFVFLLASCNKEKHYSKKLIKGETWNVQAIKVDGEFIHANTTWKVAGDDIYESVSEVSWSQASNGLNTSTFQWQFQDKGKSWVLNNLCNCDEADGTLLDDLDFLADDISGKYEVIKHKRKEMVFRSSVSKKYPGQVVEIVVKRID